MNEIIKSGLPDFKNREGQIEQLCARYHFVSKIEVGFSVLGRQLTALRIGEPDNMVLLAGAFHGQEWINSSLLLSFAEELCRELDSGGMICGMDCRRALLGRGVMILPCVNPDGIEIALYGTEGAGDLAAEVERISSGDFSEWNANARGVDLNHNYNAGWHIVRQLERASGIDGPSPRRYGGEAPESEPETQAMVRLCEKYSFRSVYAFHSQGEEIYWHYGEHTPPKAALMAKVLAASSGYTAAEPEGMASHGGFKDWFIKKYHRPGFTIETGKGKNPLPISQLEEIYSRLRELLMLAVVM